MYTSREEGMIVTYPGRAPGPLSSSHCALDVGAAVDNVATDGRAFSWSVRVRVTLALDCG